jgi:hypothetical protein
MKDDKLKKRKEEGENKTEEHMRVADDTRGDDTGGVDMRRVDMKGVDMKNADVRASV